MIGNEPKQWLLLLRATRDGFDKKTFHQLCDDKGATLVVARVKHNGALVGGYTAVAWKSSGERWKSDTTAFLFNNRADTGVITKFPIKPNKTRYAVQHSSIWGVYFGYRHNLDLLDFGTAGVCGNDSYDIPGSDDLAGKGYFVVAEVEVFAV